MRGSILTRVVLLLQIPFILLPVTGCQPEPILPEQEFINIKHTLGYVIAPTWLPGRFEFSDNMTLPSSTITYRNLDRSLSLIYPAQLPPSLGGNEPLLEGMGLDWQPPEDAVSSVNVNNEEAYIIQGFWSTETVQPLILLEEEKLKNITPEWDYDIYKRLFFRFRLSDGQVVDVALVAAFYPDWISSEDMVRIADSCVQAY